MTSKTEIVRKRYVDYDNKCEIEIILTQPLSEVSYGVLMTAIDKIFSTVNVSLNTAEAINREANKKTK